MIGSFMMAFKPGEAELHVKTNDGANGIIGYPETPTDSLREWMSNKDVLAKGWNERNVSSSIRLYTSQISESQIVALHGHCDIYLSLSRGEGWDIPAFCSKLAGNIMVYTPNGGPCDYASVDDYEVPNVGTVDCHRVYGWQDGATYLDIESEASVPGLKSAARRVSEKRDSSFSMNSFRANDVGHLMLKNLAELVGDSGKVY